MNKEARISFCLSVALVSMFSSTTPAFAHNEMIASAAADNKALARQFLFSASGWTAPKSIVAFITAQSSTSVKSDSQGNFSFRGITIPRGLTDFCMLGEDGEGGAAKACFSLPHALGNISMSKLFLPPTLRGATLAYERGSVTISGKTLPDSQITLTINYQTNERVTADANGKYAYTLRNLSLGTYVFSATATLGTRESINPSSRITVKVVPFRQYLFERIASFFHDMLTFFSLKQ